MRNNLLWDGIYPGWAVRILTKVSSILSQLEKKFNEQWLGSTVYCCPLGNDFKIISFVNRRQINRIHSCIEIKNSITSQARFARAKIWSMTSATENAACSHFSLQLNQDFLSEHIFSQNIFTRSIWMTLVKHFSLFHSLGRSFGRVLRICRKEF